jgi:hypothetical protein
MYDIEVPQALAIGLPAQPEAEVAVGASA